MTEELKDGTATGRCPDCSDGVLRIRTNSENGSRFVGCSNYPQCRHTEGLPTHIRMRAAGALTLPGFDGVA